MATLYCPMCGQPMHTYDQEMIRPDRSKYTITTGECRQPGCVFNYKTASEQTLLDGSAYGRYKLTAKYDVTTGEPLALCAA
jgi:hypothetical protein